MIFQNKMILRRHVLACLCLFFSISLPCASGGDISPDNIVEKIKAQEKTILNLAVRNFEYHEWQIDPNGKWTLTPVCLSGDAWINGVWGSKIRAKLNRVVRKWENGAYPFTEIQEDLSYDGGLCRSVTYRQGGLGHSFPSTMAMIEQDASLELTSDSLKRATGAAFCLNFIRFNGQSIGDDLTSALAKHVHLEISHDLVNGFAAIKFRSGSSPGDARQWSVTSWFSPDHNFALVQYEMFTDTPHGPHRQLISVNRFVEAGKNFWYPAGGFIEEVSRNTHTKCSFQISSAIVNDPAFTEDKYVAPIPANCFVDDRAHQTTYTQGMSPDKLATEISENVALVKAAGLGSVATEIGNIASSDNKAPSAQHPDTRHDISTIILIVGSLACILLIFVIRKLRVASLLIFLMITTPGRGAQLSPSTQPQYSEIPDISDCSYHLSCGVNVTFAALQLLGVNANIDQIASALDVGPHWEKPCSFATMMKVLSSNGVSAKAYKADSLTELLKAIPDKGISIIRIDTDINRIDVGHFICVIRTLKGYAIIDPPKATKFVRPSSVARNSALSRATGEFLVLRRTADTTMSSSKPKLELDTDLVEMGELGVNSTIAGNIVFRNSGSGTLRINDIRFSCGCTKKAEGDRVVEPGQQGILRVYFDRSQIGPGSHLKAVLLITNDDSAKEVVVRFHFNIPFQAQPDEVSASPVVINFGRQPIDLALSAAIPVEVRIPASLQSASDATIKASTSDQELGLISSGSEITTPAAEKFPAFVVHRYNLKWIKSPKLGAHQDNITFIVTEIDGTQHKLEVPVVGEFVASNKI